MTCRGCGRAWCRCRFDSSGTMTEKGSGSGKSPIAYDVKVDPATNNLIRVTSEGLLVQMPAIISRPIAFKVRNANTPVVLEDLDPVYAIIDLTEARVMSFDHIVYDTAGVFNTSTFTFTAPRSGLYELGGMADTVDEDVFMLFSVLLEGKYSLVEHGAFFQQPGDGFENYITHIELEQGAEVQMVISSDVFDATMERCWFWGSHLGD